MRRLLLLAAALAIGQPPQIHWLFGPTTIALTPSLTQAVPSGWVYAQTGEMQRFLKATGNPLTGKELAVIAPADHKSMPVGTVAGESLCSATDLVSRGTP